MTTPFSQIKWERIAMNTFSVYVFSFLAMMGIIMSYAMYLGSQARGAPDPGQIAPFANQYAPLFGSYGLIPFTFLAARRMTHKLETATQSHGIVLGVIVSALYLVISRSLGLDILISVVLTIAAGWLGTHLSARK